MRKTNRFERGTGAYKCRCCGRGTRSTGRGDNENVMTCAECYDLAGIENAITDGVEPEDNPGTVKEVNALWNAIKAKGGTPNFQYMKMIKEA
jgi:hypothetical protein